MRAQIIIFMINLSVWVSAVGFVKVTHHGEVPIPTMHYSVDRSFRLFFSPLCSELLCILFRDMVLIPLTEWLQTDL